MKRENIKNKLYLYENGNTSLKEENDLVEELGNSKSGENVWFRFLKESKKSAPKDLKNDIWESIQHIEKRRKLFRIGFGTAAASIVLAVALIISIDFHPQKQMSTEEKEAALEEAFAMISTSSDKPVLGEIMYEDEKLIIYLK